MSENTETPAPPAKKGGGKLVVLVALVLVLVGGGGAGAYWWTHRAPVEAHSEPAEAEPENAGIVALEPFVVNLADNGNSRYLRTTLRIVVDDADHAKEITEHEVTVMRLRSAILELLAVQTSDRLITPEGKATLKKAIAARGTEILRGPKVIDVLFSDFVVQF
jgi:flagellar FliL protein